MKAGNNTITSDRINSDCGILYVVSTPIGNLDDLSPRAVQVFQSVDLILTEDTRRFMILAERFQIKGKWQSLHEQNEEKQIPGILGRLQQGEKIALASEAGTPTISDPGFRLIRACRANKISVSPVPGACAAIAALSASGFEPDRFLFLGFPPRKPGKHRAFTEVALTAGATAIIYESPFRIVKTLEEIHEQDPKREVCVARELTKAHEEFLIGTVEDVLQNLKARNAIKGEIVLLVRRNSEE